MDERMTDLDDAELVRQISADVKTDKDALAKWREEAREAYAFVSGEQWSDEDKADLQEQLRPVITFNRIAPVVDAVVGSEVSNRVETRFIPREMGDVGVNELLTAAAEWVRDECDASEEESDAFMDAIIGGIGWTETRLSYDDDPEGKILIERVDPLEMGWDACARKRNLNDARRVWREKQLEKSDIEALWPDKLDEIEASRGEEEDFGGPNIREPGDDYASGGESTATKPAKYRVIEYQWYERVPTIKMVDPFNGQMAEMDEQQFGIVTKRLAKLGAPSPKHVRQVQKRYRQAFVCGETLLEVKDSPCKHGFTFRAITGKRDRNRNSWYGIVRAMLDPQRWANKFFSQILYVVNSNAKGGVMAETTAVDNVRKFEETWADPSGVTWVRDGAIAQGKIMPKQAITYPAGLDRMMEFAVTSIRDVTGVNLEMLGMADRQQAGVLEYQRKQAGLTILASMFDSLRKYRKEQGRVLLHFITQYISDERLIRIKGKDGSQKYVPLVRMPETITFDVIVDEAPTSPNQKEKTWQLLMQLLPMVAKIMPIPPEVMGEIIRYSPLPESFAQKVIEAAQPKPEDEAEKKAMKQLGMRGQVAEVAKTEAEAADKRAEAQKTTIEAQQMAAMPMMMPMGYVQ